MNQKIIIAGGSGFLGRARAFHFQPHDFEIIVLSRSPRGRSLLTSAPTYKEVAWDTCNLGPWQTELEGATAVVNLTGKSVNCRYNAVNRREIMDSRVNSTRVLGEAIAQCKAPPKVWLNASTATVYKHTLRLAWDENGQ